MKTARTRMLGALAGLAATGGILGTTVLPSQLNPTTSVNTDTETVGAHPQVERPDTTHVRVTRYYRRYGDARARIEPTNGPETTIRSIAVSFDSSGNVAAYDGSMRSEDGSPLQKVSLVAGKLVQENFVTNDTTTLHIDVGSLTAKALSSRNAEEAAGKATRIASAGGGTLQADGTLVLTVPASLPSITTSTGVVPDDGYTIPYVADLDPLKAYSVVTIDPASAQTLDLATYVETAGGDQVLIERRTVEQDYTEEDVRS